MAAGFLPSIIRGDSDHLVYASADESLNAFHDQIADAIELFPCHPRHGSMCKRVPCLHSEFKDSPGEGPVHLGNISGDHAFIKGFINVKSSQEVRAFTIVMNSGDLANNLSLALRGLPRQVGPRECENDRTRDERYDENHKLDRKNASVLRQ